MRVLMGMVGVLLLLIVVAGLVLAGACGLDVGGDTVFELGVQAAIVQADMPATPPTVDAAVEFPECAGFDAGVAGYCDRAIHDNVMAECLGHDTETKASGAAGVMPAGDAGVDDLRGPLTRSGRFSGDFA